jgi:hypothetical protein
MQRVETRLLAKGWRSARTLGVAGFLLFGCLGLIPTPARADIEVFTLNATVGDLVSFNPSAGPFTGLTVTGTLDVDTVTDAVTAVDITVQGDPNVFTNILFPKCPAGFCTVFGANNGLLKTEGATLDLGGPLSGFTGGPLGLLSTVDLANPLGGKRSLRFYELSGTLTTPEPGAYGALAIGLGGLLFAAWRRRRA